MIEENVLLRAPLKQKYEVEVGNVAVSLVDDRLLIIDNTKNSAIAFLHVPSTIVALDYEVFLVPADFLKAGHDAAGDNEVPDTEPYSGH